MLSSGHSTTVTPRYACAANGNETLVNSPAATSTRAPSGSAAATSPTSGETDAPIATRSTGTPTSSANAARPDSTAGSKSAGCAAPRRQSAIASATGSATATGGIPMLAVFR